MNSFVINKTPPTATLGVNPIALIGTFVRAVQNLLRPARSSAKVAVGAAIEIFAEPHEKHHQRLAKNRYSEVLRPLVRGATHVVNTSLVEPYLKAVRRMDDPTVRYRDLDPKRHRTIATRYPDLGRAAGDAKPLLEGLSGIAAEHAMALRLCSNPEYDMPASQCCSLEGFEPYGPCSVRQVAELGKSPSRTGCHCLKTVDMGMNNTCIAGCRYCYAVQSQKSATNNLKRHHPSAATMR